MTMHEPWRRLLLRTEASATAYEHAQATEPAIDGCRLCVDSATLTEFTHWRLMPNRFPYDRYFEVSHMLVSKRHTSETGLNTDEQAELRHLKQSALGKGYDVIFENLPKQQSIPHHVHFHIIKLKRVDE